MIKGKKMSASTRCNGGTMKGLGDERLTGKQRLEKGVTFGKDPVILGAIIETVLRLRVDVFRGRANQEDKKKKNRGLDWRRAISTEKGGRD